MKTYLRLIKKTQTLMLLLGIVILLVLPSVLAFYKPMINQTTIDHIYSLAHFSLFLVMVVRPLADVFRGVSWIRPLVILRKGFGVFSASIIVSFVLEKIILNAGAYFSGFTTAAYWSLHNLALFAHLADISAILLLVTSNNLSKRLLGKNWKRIQRLSYVYFYGSGLYVVFVLGDTLVAGYLVIVTFFTILAWLRNHGLIMNQPNVQPSVS